MWLTYLTSISFVTLKARKNYNTNAEARRKDYNTFKNTGIGRNKYITNTNNDWCDWRISPLHHLPISSHAPLDLKLRGAEIHFQYLTWRILFEYGLDVSILCVVPFVWLKSRMVQRIGLSSYVRIVHYSLSEKSTSRAWNWSPMSILMSILSLTDLIV